MTTIKPGLEAIAIRRTTIADANKVHYRVYTSPTEFTLVVAESALMAVRVSGVKAPHKIVRELAGEGGKVDSGKLVRNDLSVSVDPSIQKPAKEELKQYFTELAEAPSEDSVLFVPMGLADLRTRGMTRARILPAEMLQEIISEHAKQQSAAPEAPAPVAEPEEEAAPATAAPVAAPELSQAEKVTQLADQILPPASEETSATAEPAELSPEDVKKLLDE